MQYNLQLKIKAKAGKITLAGPVRQGGVVLDDGPFLACESSLRHKAVMRSGGAVFRSAFLRPHSSYG